MRILLALSVVGILLPGVARAQQSPDGTHPGMIARPRVEMQELAAAASASSSLQLPTPAPTPPALTRRRRGSMVGYIEDATIESKVRLRFDTAHHTPFAGSGGVLLCEVRVLRRSSRERSRLRSRRARPAPGRRRCELPAADSGGGVRGRFASVVDWADSDSMAPAAVVHSGHGGTFPNQTGFGDLRMGVKLAAVDKDDAALTAKAQLFLPTGDPAKGFGTDHASVEPAVLYLHRLSDVVTLGSEFGVWFPIGGALRCRPHADGQFSGTVMFYGIGPSFTVYETDRVRFAPVVELIGWRVHDGNQTSAEGSDASGTNIVNLKIGARAEVGQSSIYAGYGHALTDRTWYDDIFRFEYRYSF